MATGRRNPSKVVKDVNVIADSIASQYGVESPRLNGSSGGGGSISEETKMKLKNRTMVKTLKYKNPLNKGNASQNSKSPTPPPLSNGTRSNSNVLPEQEIAEVDTMDFNALIGDDDDDDFGNLQVPPNAFDGKTFGQYSVDFGNDDVGDVKSIFDDHHVDVTKFKKAAPPQKIAAAPNTSFVFPSFVLSNVHSSI